MIENFGEKTMSEGKVYEDGIYLRSNGTTLVVGGGRRVGFAHSLPFAEFADVYDSVTRGDYYGAADYSFELETAVLLWTPEPKKEEDVEEEPSKEEPKMFKATLEYDGVSFTVTSNAPFGVEQEMFAWMAEAGKEATSAAVIADGVYAGREGDTLVVAGTRQVGFSPCIRSSEYGDVYDEVVRGRYVEGDYRDELLEATLIWTPEEGELK